MSGAIGGTVTGVLLLPLLPIILPSAVVAGLGAGVIKQHRANKRANRDSQSQIGIDQMGPGGSALLVWMRVNEPSVFPVDISAHAEQFGGTLANVEPSTQTIDEETLAKLNAADTPAVTDELVDAVSREVQDHTVLQVPPKPVIVDEDDDGIERRRCAKCFADIPTRRLDTHVAECDAKLRIMAPAKLAKHSRSYGVSLANFRDIGGWPVLKYDPQTRRWRTGRMRTKTIFRSSSIDRANQADTDIIVNKLGIRSLMDLRTSEFCGQRGPCLRRYFMVAHRVSKKIVTTDVSSEAKRATTLTFESAPELDLDAPATEASLGRRMLRRLGISTVNKQAPESSTAVAAADKPNAKATTTKEQAHDGKKKSSAEEPPKHKTMDRSTDPSLASGVIELTKKCDAEPASSSSSEKRPTRGKKEKVGAATTVGVAAQVGGGLTFGDGCGGGGGDDDDNESDDSLSSGTAFAQEFFSTNKSTSALWKKEDEENLDRVDWGRCYRLGLVGSEFESYIVSEAPKSNVAQAAWLFMTNKGAAAYRERVVGPTLNNERGLDVLYQMLVELCQCEVNKFLQVLVKVARWPVAYYCNHGKDRTGWITALILSMCGVDRDIIIQNYALSDYFLSDIAHHVNSEMAEGGLIPSVMARTPASAMRRMLAYVDSRYGSVSNYLAYIGFGIPLQRIVASRLVDWDHIDDNDHDHDNNDNDSEQEASTSSSN